ncbi:MAG: class I SAM-dependent methyltransferase [Rhodospirillales bacterium]|jgi:ubiquinone/menaquinone biosynthesis C-methylase UbiE|nr:class I SAM-dependent methyltransferase [Rhodospirillales bacterium]
MTDTQPAHEGTAEYWESHWKRYAESTRLNPGQIYRRSLIFRLLSLNKNQAAHSKILDVSCGSGDMLEAIQDRFPTIQLAGIDQSQSGLDITCKNTPTALLKKVNLESPEPADSELSNWASHAVCSEVLEHVDNPVEVLKNIQSFLEPGGMIAITVPGGPRSAFDISIGHNMHYTPELIKDQLEQAGYDVEISAGAGFPIFNLYRLVILLRGERLSDDIDGTPNLPARFAMAIFRAMMRFSFFSTPWGWQIIARARKPL